MNFVPSFQNSTDRGPSHLMQPFAVHIGAPIQSSIVGPLFPRAKRRNDSCWGDRAPARAESRTYHYPLQFALYPTTITSRDTATTLPADADTPAGPSPATAEPESHSVSDHESPLQSKTVRGSAAYRREQRRLNQARYRYKQRTKIKLLGDAISILQQEISTLTVQRDQSFFGRKRSVYSVIVEYFHFFRHDVDVLSGARYAKFGWLQSEEAKRQQVFLQSSMAPNIMLGEGQGVEALMDQWCWYSTYFQDMELRLDRMSELSKDLVTVSASIRVTITVETLKHVFPHLLKPSEQRDLKAVCLGAKLIGVRLMLPATLQFEWDGATRQVSRLETSVDFFTPLYREFIRRA